MGAGWGYPEDVPPGGVLLNIQPRGTCCPEKPTWEHAKPGMLPIQDQDWDRFSNTVRDAVFAMKDEKYSFGAALILPIVIILPIFMRSAMPEGGLGEVASFPFAIGGVVLFLGLRFWMTSHNEKQDTIIHGACGDLSKATNGQVTIQYRTKYVGFCRPKGAQPFRAIAMAPFGGVTQMGLVAPAAQTMQVQVPAGVGPGTTLQIQAPSGQMMHVAVPDGVGPGQVFQVQVPPTQPVLVQATVVQNP